MERVAKRLEEPARDDDAVDDREVAGRGVARRCLSDDLHHGLVLLVRLLLPRLYVAGADEAKEGIRFQMNPT